MTKTYDEYFKDFIGRTERLKKVVRYRSYLTMFYRTNLAVHSKRVGWQVGALLDFFPPDIRSTLDEEKILLMAWIHDDHEIILGDRQSASDWHMTPEQFAVFHNKENYAVDHVSKLFPKTLGNYLYHDLLSEAVRVDTTESQLVKLADKIEGSGEALHEIFSGNMTFLQRMMDPDYHRENAHPIEYYGKYFDALREKLPLLEPFRTFLCPLLISLATPYDFKQRGVVYTLPTKDSLDTPSGYAPYDYWKKNFLSQASSEEGQQLYDKVE